MSIQELKKDIVARIEKINTDIALEEVVRLLNELEKNNNKSIDLSSHFDQIVNQYDEVLHKLAQ
jgi:hypothetical protein